MKTNKLTKAVMALALLAAAQTAGAQQSKEDTVLENIMTRTSIRSFQEGKAVEQAKVEKLLRAGMAAPTAMNKQPWHFVVVNTRESLDKLAATSHRGGGMFKRAPLAIVVCGDMTKAAEGQRGEFWIQDTSAAAENILLAAHAMGLGAVWTSAWPSEQKCGAIREALGLPSTLNPLCVIIAGYPGESPQPKDKWKQENVSYK